MVELVKGNVSVPAWGVGAAPGDMALDPKSFLHPAPNQSTGKGGLNTTQGLCPNSARTKVSKLQPFTAVLPQECMRQLASDGPT